MITPNDERGLALNPTAPVLLSAKVIMFRVQGAIPLYISHIQDVEFSRNPPRGGSLEKSRFTDNQIIDILK